MKKISILFVLLLMGMVTNSFGVTYPQHNGFVNDFANIISGKDKQKMETFLHDYEQKTSVEIAVVTTNSLNNMSIEEWSLGLATQWGVGKKDKDNGIVIVVAPKASKYRIEVGYGLEWVITDSVAGELGRNMLVPAFKKQDYAGGINTLLNAVTQKIGFKSSAELAKSKKLYKQNMIKAQEARKEKERKLLVNGMLMGVVGLLIFLCYLAIKFVRDFFAELKRKQELRKKIEKLVYEHVEQLNGYGDKISEAYIKNGDLPLWAQEKIRGHLTVVEEMLSNFQHEVIDVKSLLVENPDEAFADFTQRIMPMVGNIKQRLKDIDRVSEELDTYHQRSSELIQEIDSKIIQLNEIVTNSQKQGFVFDELNITELRNILEDLQSQFAQNSRGNSDNIREINAQLNELSSLVDSKVKSVEDVLWSKKRIDEHSAYLLGKVKELRDFIPQYQEKLETLISNNPKSVWDEVQVAFNIALEKLEKVDETISEAKELGSMESQLFHKALDVLDDASMAAHKLEFAYESVDDLLEAVEKAKKENPRLLREASDALQEAQRVARNSDVFHSTKNSISSLNAKLEILSKEAKGNNVHWLVLNSSLNNFIEKAETLISKAKGEIEEGERKRRRRRRSSSMAASSSSFGSSSSSSSSSFGGGSFGGGGASGSW